MIIKSLTRKSSIGQLLEYLFAKEEKTTSKPLLIRHNIRSHSLDKWIQEFATNETYRLNKRSNNIKAYHTVLSFSSKDKLHITEQTLKTIAKEYIKLRGRESLYICTAHYDKEHVHLHIVMSGTRYLTGESNRISRSDFHQLKVALDTYQQKQFPELIHSLPKHGKTKDRSIETPKPPVAWLHGRVLQKEQLQATLAIAYTKASSLEAFLSEVVAMGHEPYYRSGHLTGIRFANGRKFRFQSLGYTAESLAKLDAHTKEEKALSELRSIRVRSLERSRERGDDDARSLDDRIEK